MTDVLDRQYVLADGVEMFPATEASAPVPLSAELEPSDWIITRHASRTRSRLVSQAVAEVFQRFGTPQTIVEAIKGFSTANGKSAKETLREVFPVLQEFVGLGWLIPAEAAAPATVSRLEPGTMVGAWLLRRRVQRLSDVELWLAQCDGRFGALKIAVDAEGRSMRRLERERDILRRLESHWTPGVIEHGDSPWPYLVTEWKFGVPIDHASMANLADRLSAAADICRAYESLHACGVLHVDVHPRNVLLDRRRRLSIVDFDRSAVVTETSAAPYRGGIAFFMPPEVAAVSKKAAEYTVQSEVFSVCALVYFLISGNHYQEFRLEREQMLAQIGSPRYVSLRDRSLPQLERVCEVLKVGLARDSRERWESISALTGRLVEAFESVRSNVAPDDAARNVDRRPGGLSALGHPDESAMLPSASIGYGAAGVAYFYWRKANLLNDSESLSEADYWAELALSRATQPTAFRSRDMGLDEHSAGRRSVMFGEAGMWYVRALISHSLGDAVTRDRAVAEFVATGDDSGADDVFSGRAGHLIGLCNLHRFGVIGDEASTPLEDGLTWSCRELQRRVELAQPGSIGFAHGLAGIVYCAQLISGRLNMELPDDALRAFHMLLESGEPFDSGMRWPDEADLGTRGGRKFREGWCRGTAGMLLLIASLLRKSSAAVDRELLELAAGFLIEHRSPIHDLCCGDIGQAFALLSLLRVHPVSMLRRDIEAFITSTLGAPEGPGHGTSLLKGPLAGRLLRLEREFAEESVFPVFGQL